MTGDSRWGIVILNSVSYVIYWHWGGFVFYMLGVMNLHPANSGPDILLLLFKAPTNNWAPFSPTRLTSWAFSSSTDFSLTISCLSTGLKFFLTPPRIHLFFLEPQSGQRFEMNSILVFRNLLFIMTSLKWCLKSPLKQY